MLSLFFLSWMCERFELCCCRNNLMNLYDKIFQLHEMIAKGSLPIQGFQRIFHEVFGFNISIHTYII